MPGLYWVSASSVAVALFIAVVMVSLISFVVSIIIAAATVLSLGLYAIERPKSKLARWLMGGK